MDISYAAKNYWGENICTYNEYMHIAQALRTLIIEDKKSIRRFDGSRLPNLIPICNHQFSLETGRWINTNKNLRKRTMCDCNSTGYEFYYIFECTHFVNDRKVFSSKRYCVS